MIMVISSNIVLNRAAPASLKYLRRERDFVIVLHVNCSSSHVIFKAGQIIKLFGGKIKKRNVTFDEKTTTKTKQKKCSVT